MANHNDRCTCPGVRVGLSGGARHTTKGEFRLPETATAGPQVLPLVDHLTLGPTRDQDYLNGSRCTKCGTAYAGPRIYCGKCSSQGPFEALKFSGKGKIYSWTILYQSAPWVKVPYVAAVVDLDEGVTIRGNIEGVEPKPENVRFGMPVTMYTEPVSEDKEGNTYIAYKFRPA
jgi:uncharacterized OB-fold protein